jgi:hypothetical protein
VTKKRPPEHRVSVSFVSNDKELIKILNFEELDALSEGRVAESIE